MLGMGGCYASSIWPIFPEDPELLSHLHLEQQVECFREITQFEIFSHFLRKFPIPVHDPSLAKILHTQAVLQFTHHGLLILRATVLGDQEVNIV